MQRRAGARPGEGPALDRDASPWDVIHARLVLLHLPGRGGGAPEARGSPRPRRRAGAGGLRDDLPQAGPRGPHARRPPNWSTFTTSCWSNASRSCPRQRPPPGPWTGARRHAGVRASTDVDTVIHSRSWPGGTAGALLIAANIAQAREDFLAAGADGGPTRRAGPAGRGPPAAGARPLHLLDHRPQALGVKRVLSAGPPVLAAVCALAGWWLVTVVFDIRPFLLPAPRRRRRLRPAPRLSAPPDLADLHRDGRRLRAGRRRGTRDRRAAHRVPGRGTRGDAAAGRGERRLPKIAVAPLLVVWLGFGTAPKVYHGGAARLVPGGRVDDGGTDFRPLELTELAHSLTASRWQTYRKLRIPWSPAPGLHRPAPRRHPRRRRRGSSASSRAATRASATSSWPPAATPTHPRVRRDGPAQRHRACCVFYAVVLAERALLPWAREITG
ncbi:hypothetical protein ACRAWF_15630 [Streptomyces sp. L7]